MPIYFGGINRFPYGRGAFPAVNQAEEEEEEVEGSAIFRRRNRDAILLSCFVTCCAVVYACEEEPETRGETGLHASWQRGERRESRSIQGQTERSINTLSSCRLKTEALCLEGLPLFLFFLRGWGTFKIYECVSLFPTILAFNISSARAEILTAARRERRQTNI